MKTTFKTIVIKSHQQTMDEFAAICDVPMIRAWREHIGITQAELAVRMGVSQATVAKLERPDAKPRSATLKNVVEALGISPTQQDVQPDKKGTGTCGASPRPSSRQKQNPPLTDAYV